MAVVDRIGAIVAQQLTQRAWQQARKLRPGTSLLTAADVAAVAHKGMFDFLHASGVVDEWDAAAAEPSRDSTARGASGADGAAPCSGASVPPAAATEPPDTGAEGRSRADGGGDNGSSAAVPHGASAGGGGEAAHSHAARGVTPMDVEEEEVSLIAPAVID